MRGREEDTTVLFTKFLQLLMNDANFLLDESFRQLEEVRRYYGLVVELDNYTI